MNINLQLISKTAQLPCKAHDTDACADIYADLLCEGLEEVEIQPGFWRCIHTGFKTALPVGYFAAVFDRSGMGIKRHLRLSNSVGVIDSDYRGEWMVCLHNDGLEMQTIHHGDRIAQFTILPVLEFNFVTCDNLEETTRGQNGFGSTGR